MRSCAKPWGSENASSLHEEEGLEGVRRARVKPQLCQVQACSASGLVFLTSRMGRMSPGPYLQGSFRDREFIVCLNFGCSWQSNKEPHKLPNAGTHLHQLYQDVGGWDPGMCRSLTQRRGLWRFLHQRLCPRGRGRQDLARAWACACSGRTVTPGVSSPSSASWAERHPRL